MPARLTRKASGFIGGRTLTRCCARAVAGTHFRIVPVVKVSVIVPVYNPGHHIDDCIGSLLAQTLREVELIFVDDGSTDDTPARLDVLAAAEPRVRVEHIANSGWPGRPRNLGLDIARGDYVLFVDNDDWLAEDALERLHAAALADAADIVIGKVVAHGNRSVPRGLFRENRHGIRFDGDELLALLTPHKLFRREFLDDHAIRFPEGKRRLEDHPFVVEAYFRARRISVLADGPVYHWALRAADVNASARPFDPDGYFDNVREVLDLVTRRTPEGAFRDALLAHWYRGKMLGRVGGSRFLRRDPQYRRDLFEAVRSLQEERFGPRFDAALPLHLRARAHLLRAGDFASLEALAAFEDDLSPKIELRKLQGDGTHLVARARGRLGTQALRFAPPGERATWIPPEELRDALAGADLTVDLRGSSLQVWLRGAETEVEYLVPVRNEVTIEAGAEEDDVRPQVRAVATIAPTTAAAGAPLPAGRWELRAGVTVAGFYSARRLREEDEPLVLVSAPPAAIFRAEEVPQRKLKPPPPQNPRARAGRTFRRARAVAAGRG
jgi:glycosyltransferase involved in cell wall biosynthesis